MGTRESAMILDLSLEGWRRMTNPNTNTDNTDVPFRATVVARQRQVFSIQDQYVCKHMYVRSERGGALVSPDTDGHS